MTEAHAIPAPPDNGLSQKTRGLARASITGVAWNLGNMSASVILTFVVFLVTSRALDPADFGAVALAAAIISIVATVVPTAFGEALLQRKDLAPAHLDSVFWMALGIGGLMFGGIAALAAPIAAWVDVVEVRAILPVLALRLIFDAVATVPTALIARRMQFRSVAIRTTLANAVGAAVCLIMIAQGYALWALVVSQVVNSLIAMSVTAIAAKWRPRAAFSREAISDLARFGLFTMGGRVLNQARFDQFLLGLVLGAPALGLFYFARRLFTVLRDATVGVFSPVTNALMASLQANANKRREAYLIASFASAGLAFPVFSGLFAIAPMAVPIAFGPQWTEAVFAVQCLSVIGLMAALGIIQASSIRYLGRPDWWFRYQAVVQLSSIPIILVLYPFGLNIIMVAMAGRTLILWPLSVRMAQILLDISLPTYLRSLRGPALGSIVMVAAVVALPYGVQDLSGGGLVALQIGLGATIYGGVLALLSHRQIMGILAMLRQRRVAS